jgi:hypothetical protein
MRAWGLDERKNRVGAIWTISGDAEHPTICPSIIGPTPKECHLYIRNGHLEFLADCKHALAGQTIPMAPF